MTLPASPPSDCWGRRPAFPVVRAAFLLSLAWQYLQMRLQARAGPART